MLNRSSKAAKPKQEVGTVFRRKTAIPLLNKRKTEKMKDPLAVELGRRGGLKGGRARAEKLSPQERRSIAKRAALARWASRG